MTVGKLENVPLRELWKREEDFSDWLRDNIEALSEKLDLNLSAVERERTAGSFQTDLVAEDGDNNLVIIESQVEPTNHDHLGKVLTYLTNLEAKAAIWITSEARAEHVRAVAWLNEATPADVAFYLVQLEAYRIGDSEPAPLFTVIAGPSAETKAIGGQKKDLAERHVLRLRFWEQLLARARRSGLTLHANVSPSKQNWISTGAGKSGLSFNYVILVEDKADVELYIDTRDADENKRVFDKLYSSKQVVEDQFGGQLEWQRLDNRRASRIRSSIEKGGLKDEDGWPAIQDTMIDAMDRLSRALKPHIRALRE